MNDTPRIGLALIARDEETTLPGLLASIAGAFDQVVLVDTGSTDKTRHVFREWGFEQRKTHPDFRFNVDRHPWVDDFAAARQHADSLFDEDITWLAWADADDEIHGAEHLRALAAQAAPDTAAYVAGYRYAVDEHGQTICYLRRERLVRRGAGTWAGRVHEAQFLTGPVVHIDPQLVEWRHRKTAEEVLASNDRNLRILTAWQKDEPENTRVLQYLGTEHLARGDIDAARSWFHLYLEQQTEWDEERAQVHRKLAVAHIASGQPHRAVAIALEAIALLPSWPDSYLTLAEAHIALGEHAKAAYWAQETLRHGAPDTMLIVNPRDYDVQPRVILAEAAAALGDIDAAIAAAEDALQLAAFPALAQRRVHWLAQRKREDTANAFLSAARVLVEHDEQAKALILLEQTVPHYAQDHARVVQARSELRERLAPFYDPDGYATFYEESGSKPEDFIPDDQVTAICEQLPRALFLAEGLRELEAETA